MVISLEFTKFDIERHRTCRYDYLMIEDGDGTTLMEKSCGTSLPANIRSKTNVVKLIFKTDKDTTRSGWEVKWKAVLPSECLKLLFLFRHTKVSSTYPSTSVCHPYITILDSSKRHCGGLPSNKGPLIREALPHTF